MLDISLAGLIGAIAGTVVAGVSYHLSLGALPPPESGRVGVGVHSSCK